MKKSYRKTITTFFAGIFVLASLVSAQDNEPKGNVVSMSYYNIKYDMIDEYMDYLEENKQLWDKVDEILSIRVLRHWWAGNWNVVIIRDWKSLASMETGLEQVTKLTKEKYPDKEVREKRSNKAMSMVMSHWDDICRDVISLTK